MTPAPSDPGSPDGPGATRTEAPSQRASREFGAYRLLQRLGEGGMGEVWLAEQLQPVRRQVAIKVVKAGMDTARVVARFEAERQALALMDHPAIAKVFDGGTTPEGRPYFAMEYVRGEPITTYCDRQRLPVRDRLELFIQLCDGVQHAHQKGIIHRDLKPSNVLVAVHDDRPVPRIIDFGIAKAVAQPLTEHSLYTELGMFIGTPEYMSPEQAEMTPLDVDTRSDVYSLGVVLYELLVGTLPFDRATLRKAGLDEVRRIIREERPPRPSTHATRDRAASTDAAERRAIEPSRLAGVLRGDLDWITMKALEKDRTRRYQTANAMALDVRRHLNHEPVSAGPPSTVYRTRKFVQRHRGAVAAAVVLVMLLASFSVVMAIQAARIARERDRANAEAETARRVSGFLVDMFRVSDPSEARGNTLTARDILARGAARLESGLGEQPQVQARLQATIGGVHTGLGSYADAQALLEKALRTQRQTLGDDHPETLATEHELANAFWYQTRFQDAEPLYRDVVDRRTRNLGADDPETLKAAFDLASLFIRQKRWAEFDPLARDVLARQRRLLGNDHPDTLASLGNIGSAYYSQDRFAESATFAEEDLERSRRGLGSDHPHTLTAMHNLATVYERLNRAREAEALFLEASATKRRVLGGDHPQTCLTVFRLASFYKDQRRYVEAERAAQEAYQGYTTRLGADHADARRVALLLAEVYDQTGQPVEARRWRGLAEDGTRGDGRP